MEDYKLYAMTKEELEQYLSQITDSMEDGKEKDDLIKKINDRINGLNEIEESEKARFSQRFEQWKADQEINGSSDTAVTGKQDLDLQEIKQMVMGEIID